MATYDSLTNEQKDVLGEWDKQHRAFLGQLAKLIAVARALDAAAEASGGADSIVASLDAGQIVPNSSGFAGAQNLTKEELQAIRAAGLADFLLTYDTDAVRRVIAKAKGPTAGV